MKYDFVVQTFNLFLLLKKQNKSKKDSAQNV